jgi:hypothetical protein
MVAKFGTALASWARSNSGFDTKPGLREVRRSHCGRSFDRSGRKVPSRTSVVLRSHDLEHGVVER